MSQHGSKNETNLGFFHVSLFTGCISESYTVAKKKKKNPKCIYGLTNKNSKQLSNRVIQGARLLPSRSSSLV